MDVLSFILREVLMCLAWFMCAVDLNLCLFEDF